MNKQTKYASTILISILVCAAMVFSRGIINTAEAFQNNVAEGYEGCLPPNFIPLETVIKDNENLLPASGGGRGLTYDQPLQGTITKLILSEPNGSYVKERMYIQSRNASILVYSDYFAAGSAIGIGAGIDVGNVVHITGGFQCVNYNGKYELVESRNVNNEIISYPVLQVVASANQYPVEPLELTGDIWKERTNKLSSNYFAAGDIGRQVSFSGLTVTNISGNNITFRAKDSNQNSVEVAAYVEGPINPNYRADVVSKLAGAMNDGNLVNLDCVLSRYQGNATSSYTVQLGINLLGDISVVSAPVEGDEPVELTILGVNDFHGAVKETGSNPGIVRLGGAIKAYDQDSTIVISAGDMFQGSLESNYNYGELITAAMTNIGFDAMTIGNHEFDWGTSKIAVNEAAAGFPFLGANIYDYEMASLTPLGDFAGAPFSKYTIIEKADLRVGIIGTIGADQITSISSQFVDMYAFIDPIPVIKDLSDELRNEEDCDVIIVNHHGDQDELLGNGLTAISPETNHRYIDLAMCAHSHQNEASSENGVYFLQTAGYGKTLAKAVLSVSESAVNSVDWSTSENSFGPIDDELNVLVQSYTDLTDSLSTVPLAEVAGGYNLSTEQASNLYNKAIYEAAKAIDSNVLMAIGNNARSGLTVVNSYITFGTLYNSLPFDNEVFIGYVSGADLLRQLGFSSNYAYSPTGFTWIDSSQTYCVAVLDYVGLHRNALRQYDYMPSLIIDKVVPSTNYREITKTYLLSNYYNNNNAYLYPNDYSSTEFGFNKSS